MVHFQLEIINDLADCYDPECPLLLQWKEHKGKYYQDCKENWRVEMLEENS